jgi:glycosyltransferase involved in cell wall biosynthesis
VSRRAVSVVVPARNAERTLGECLAALEGQSPPGLAREIIVVDDGSTDRTADVAARCPRVVVVRQANQGPAAARNAGARRATGDVLLFTDADCVPTPDWVAEMTAPLEDPAVVAVKGAYRTRQVGLVARFAQIEFEERYARLALRPTTDFVDSYSAAIRAEAFWAVGGFDATFPDPNNEDVDLSYRLARAGRPMVFNPRAIVYHRHPDRLGRYLRTKFWRGYWRTIVYRRFPEKAVADSYTPQLLKAQILFMFGVAAGLVLAPLLSGADLVARGSGLGFLATAVPFTIRAWRADAALGIVAPLLLAMRAGALGLGAVWALLGGVWRFPAKAPVGPTGS